MKTIIVGFKTLLVCFSLFVLSSCDNKTTNPPVYKQVIMDVSGDFEQLSLGTSGYIQIMQDTAGKKFFIMGYSTVNNVDYEFHMMILFKNSTLKTGEISYFTKTPLSAPGDCVYSYIKTTKDGKSKTYEATSGKLNIESISDTYFKGTFEMSLIQKGGTAQITVKNGEADVVAGL